MLKCACILAILATPAAAIQCGDYSAISQTLTDKYGESLHYRGVTSETRLFELWTSDTGTWSMLAVDADGRACLATAGEYGTEYIPQNTDDPA